MSQAAARPPDAQAIDENEDLFNFDELAESRESPSAPVNISSTLPDQTEAALTALFDAEEPRAPLPKPSSPAAAPASLAASGPVAVGGTLARFALTRLSAGWSIALAAAAVFNLVLVGLVWRSTHTIQSAMREMGERVALQHDQLRFSPAPTAEPAPLLREVPSLFGQRPEGLETLDRAAQALERGDFELARQALWSLLAVADRLPEKDRADIEARAGFLIADSFRLQADALRSDADGADGHPKLEQSHP